MATIQTKINRALRLLGVIASGETPAAAESSDALEALNGMLDSWRNDKLLVYAFQDIQITLINGTATYTIGATGGTVTTSPVTMESAFVRQSGVDYPLTKITDAVYQSKSDKTVTSDIPSEIMFNHTNPNSTITLYPVPTTANTLHLRVWTPLATVALSDTFTFPPGYDDAIVYNLVLRLHPEYPSIPLNPAVIETARTSLAGIKRINAKPFIAVTQLARMFVNNRTKVDIYAGE